MEIYQTVQYDKTMNLGTVNVKVEAGRIPELHFKEKFMI